MENNHLPNPSEFASRDIYISSVLKAAGIPIIRVENHLGKGVFVFNHSPKIEELVTRYFNSKLKLDAKTLFETWKGLKALAFSTVNISR